MWRGGTGKLIHPRKAVHQWWLFEKGGCVSERRWSEGKGKRKSKRFEEKTEQGERQRDRERSRRGERERKREQRTDNASGVGPFIYPSYGTHTVMLPAQPAMIKYLQHEENKGSTHVKNDFEEKERA